MPSVLSWLCVCWAACNTTRLLLLLLLLLPLLLLFCLCHSRVKQPRHTFLPCRLMVSGRRGHGEGQELGTRGKEEDEADEDYEFVEEKDEVDLILTTARTLTRMCP